MHGSEVDALCDAAAELSRLAARVAELEGAAITDAAVESLRGFAREILDPERRYGEWDGADLQELAIKHGLFVEIPVTEPCGEACICAEVDDFPQTCYRFSGLLRSESPQASAEEKA